MDSFAVKELFSMQDGFRRSANTMNEMFEFVAAGGVYDQVTLAQRRSDQTDPIVLNRFEDNRMYVHDGIHRVASILKARPSGEVYSSEFRLQTITYSEYQQINRSASFFTPFDPRIEVRVADFSEFKAQALQIIERGADPTEFINNNRHIYVRPREAHHDSIEQLIRFFHSDIVTEDSPAPAKIGEI